MKKRFLFVCMALVLISCQLFTPGTVNTPTTDSPVTVTDTPAQAVSSTDTPEAAKPSATPESEASQPTPTRTARTQSGPVEASLVVDTSQPIQGVELTRWQPQPYAGTLDALPIDLRKVVNADTVKELTDEERDFLTKNGFLVLQTGEEQFYDMCHDVAERQGQPYFVTTDSAYHTLHLTFDDLLKALERDQFRPEMAALTEIMLKQVQEYQAELQGTPIEADAQQAVAYLAVALRLFETDASIPADVEKVVAAQLAQIEAAGGRDQSALFPNFEDDYGAYKPVGHYTGDPGLESYFKGMTWYGRVSVSLKDKPTRLPLIITLALREAEGDYRAVDLWSSVHKTLTYFIGPSDDSGPVELSALMDQVYGPDVTINDLADDGLWQQFVDRVDELPAPQINSTFAKMTAQMEAQRDWRLMGQRFTLDGFIMQNVVYDKVGTDTNKRLFPSGLDVMSVFGSQAAAKAQETAGETQYQNYTAQIEKMQAAVKAQPEPEWLNRFYSSWLYAFMPQIVAKDAAFPPYMRTEAWGYKDLNSALGSWAELKHDTVLYTKMPEGLGGGGPPSSGPGLYYVEPNPQVFYQLAYMADSLYWAVTGAVASYNTGGPAAYEPNAPIDLETLTYEVQSIAEHFKGFGDIAAKELAGQALEEGDMEFLHWTNCPTTQQRYGLEEPKPIPVVAAVAGADQSVLEAAVGNLDRIYVIVPINGQLQIAQGGVFSYYEFKVSRDQRLTDEEWRERLASGVDERPAYTAQFLKTAGERSYALAFRIGDVYIITKEGGNPPLNMRANPSKSAAVVTKLPEGEYITIIDGPVVADGGTWWKVQIAGYSQEGWVLADPAWYDRAWGQ